MSKFFRVWDYLETTVLGKAAQGFFLFSILLVFIEVPRRYIFGATFSWSSEIVIYSFLVAIWFYFGITLAEGGHIRITVLTDHMSERLRRYTEIFADAVGIAFCLILGWNCSVIIPKVLISGSMLETLDLPMVVIFFCFLLGVLSLLIRYMEDMYHKILTVLSREKVPSHG